MPRNAAPANPLESDERSPLLPRVAWIVVCALLIARATFSQPVRDADLPTPGQTPVVSGAGATASVVLDWLMCAPVLLVMLHRLLDSRFTLRGNWSHLLFLLLAALAALSGFWASDKFAAAVTASQLVAAGVLMWTMSQLVRSWLHVRLVAAMCFGLVLVCVAHAAIYKLIDVPDNVRYWEQHRDEELRRRGWEPGSFQAIQFEKKLQSGELIGFNTSPNSFAAVLVLLAVVSAGAAIQRIVDRDEPGWAGAIVVALAPVGWLLHSTHSKTAYLTPIVAAAILGMAAFGSSLRRHRRGLYITTAALGVIIAAAVVGYGLLHNSLGIASMTFRWHYWYGGAKIFEQHPWLGVGWANFGSHYLGVRLPIASEEVKDPHNLIVRCFIELGLLGGALMLAWLARAWWEMTAAPTLPASARPARSLLPSHGTSITIGAICILGMLVNLLATNDLTPDTSDGSWFIMLEIMKRSLYVGLLLLGFAAVSLHSSKRPELDDRPAPWMLCGILAAVTVFLLHNLVDFSIFEPGPMWLLAALVGAVLGATAPADSSPRPTRLLAIGFAGAVAAWLLLAALFVAPIATAEAHSNRGNALIRQDNPAAAIGELTRAYESLWFPNGDYAYRAAIAMQMARVDPKQTLEMLDRAVAADPMNVSFYRHRAGFAIRQPSADPQAVIEDFEKVIALDPNEVSAHIDFAEALTRLGLRQRAIDEYRTALRYNDLLDPNEPKRLSPGELSRLNAAIRALGG